MPVSVVAWRSLQISHRVLDNFPGSFFSTFVVRVNGRAEDYVAMIRDAIRSVDMRVPVFGVLVVIGSYGVVSYAVSQRTHEMGVRLALGTTPVRLPKEVLGQGLLSVAAGAIFGIVGAMLIGRFLEHLVNGAKLLNPMMLTLLILFVFVIASTSIWAATRRIATLDVMDILRIQ